MKYAINLFPQKQKDLRKSVAYFSAHYLRYIVVLTQLLVMCVFLFRFSIDQKIIDEKEKLAQKKAIVEATAAMRKDLVQSQKNILTIKTILATQDTWTAQLEYIRTIFPAAIQMQELSVTDAKIHIRGVAADQRIIQAFIQRLVADKKFVSVVLESIVHTATGYDFSLTLDNTPVPTKVPIVTSSPAS